MNTRPRRQAAIAAASKVSASLRGENVDTRPQPTVVVLSDDDDEDDDIQIIIQTAPTPKKRHAPISISRETRQQGVIPFDLRLLIVNFLLEEDALVTVARLTQTCKTWYHTIRGKESVYKRRAKALGAAVKGQKIDWFQTLVKFYLKTCVHCHKYVKSNSVGWLYPDEPRDAKVCNLCADLDRYKLLSPHSLPTYGLKIEDMAGVNLTNGVYRLTDVLDVKNFHEGIRRDLVTSLINSMDENLQLEFAKFVSLVESDTATTWNKSLHQALYCLCSPEPTQESVNALAWHQIKYMAFIDDVKAILAAQGKTDTWPDCQARLNYWVLTTKTEFGKFADVNSAPGKFVAWCAQQANPAVHHHQPVRVCASLGAIPCRSVSLTPPGHVIDLS